MSKRTVRGFRTSAGLAGALMATAVLSLPGSVRAADAQAEQDHADVLSAIGGVHLGATLTGLVPEPLTALIAEGVAFSSNLALKGLEPALIEPSDRARYPNSADQCTFDFDLPQADFLYSNTFGLELSPVPSDWGELGTPDVFHWGTEVALGVHNPIIRPSLIPRQNISFPAGNHSLEWRAQTIIDVGFDVVLPAAMLYMSYSKFKASKAAPAAVAGNADEVAKQKSIFKRAGKWMVDKLKLAVQKGRDQYINYLIDEATGWETPTRTKSHEQIFTVYDELDPIITYDGVDQPAGGTIPSIVLEATDIGGVNYYRVADQLRARVGSYDPCDRNASIGAEFPELIPIGSNLITWTALDAGPTPSGERNEVLAYQYIIVEDTQAPIMVTPPGRVFEVDPAGPNSLGLPESSVEFGAPRVVDLADPAPSVFSDAPEFFPVDSRTAVTWTARDHSGNENNGTQLITVKELGTNTAPTVEDLFATTLTSEPIDIVLQGMDLDLLDGVPDPLGISIASRPENGEFVAPLLPFFIEDFRTAVGGPYGLEFANTGNKGNWLYDNVCQTTSGSYNDRIPVDWVYNPKFVHVEDDGTYFMIDSYWRCGPSNATTYERISKWDVDDNFLGHIQYGGTNDAFVMDQDGIIYTVSRTGAGSSTTLRLAQIRPNIEDGSADLSGDSWRFDYASAENDDLGLNDPIVPSQLSYARVDSNAGLLYLTDRRRIFVYDIRDHLNNGQDDSDNSMGDRYMGALNNAEQVLCNVSSNYGSSWTGFTMEVDSEGNLYATDSCDNRIHKFAPSGFDADGNFVAGEYIGWLGRCESSTNNACDVENQRSRGYVCTNDTCLVSDYYEDEQSGNNVRGTLGREPGQFATPRYIDLDPNDVLYVADANRIQRFARDGSFGGEARSTGTGINQGERPGFILGNMGNVKAVTVNSTNFFVVDTEESFIHVFETTPLKDITDDSATVTYVSNHAFHGGTDTFTYRATDGLDESNLGTVSVQVNRNYRPPEAFQQQLEVLEDSTLAIELTGDDPDGVIGTDDVFPLDTISFQVVDQPEHGTLTGTGENRTYTPDADFFGSDSFTFVTNDGRDDSPAAVVDITVHPVDDAPRMLSARLPARVSAGFPIALDADYTDDGSAAEHDVRVDWGDAEEGIGDFYDPDGPEGEQPPELIGVKVIEPVLREGTGNLFAEHVYSTPGTQDVSVCVSDDIAEDCITDRVFVEHLVNLGITISDDPDETTGAYIDLDIEVENMEPEGIAGVIAGNVQLTQAAEEVPEITIQSIVSQSGACSLTSGALSCSDNLMSPGEAFNATVRVRRSESSPLIYDLGAPVVVDVTTASDALQDAYTQARWITFLADQTDTDGDGMTDVFEQTYGLNSSSGSDAGTDIDGDGLTNLEEFERRANPLLTDTDGDGVEDAHDFCPADPGGSVEGTDGLCESELRSNPLLRLLEVIAER